VDFVRLTEDWVDVGGTGRFRAFADGFMRSCGEEAIFIVCLEEIVVFLWGLSAIFCRTRLCIDRYVL